MLPDVATTETFVDTGAGLELPPHPLSSPALSERTAITHSFEKRRRRLQKRQLSATARLAGGSSGRDRSGSSLAEDEAETVSVTCVCVPAEGVTVAGRKEQVAPAGNPVQLKVVGALKPNSGVTEITIVALSPGSTVSEVAEAEIVNIGGIV